MNWIEKRQYSTITIMDNAVKLPPISSILRDISDPLGQRTVAYPNVPRSVILSRTPLTAHQQNLPASLTYNHHQLPTTEPPATLLPSVNSQPVIPAILHKVASPLDLEDQQQEQQLEPPEDLENAKIDNNIDSKPKTRKYKCKVCEKGFTTSGHLARHSRIHTGERKHVCPFPNCNQRFARHDNCMQHYKTHKSPASRGKRVYTRKPHK